MPQNNTAPTDANKSLWKAARAGDLPALLGALERGACVDYQNMDDEVYSMALATPLCHACKGGFTDCVSALISAGADMSRVDRQHLSPLAYSSLYDHPDCIDALLQGGFNISGRDWHMTLALQHAIRGASPRCMTKLIEAGVGIESTFDNNLTALAEAATVSGDAGLPCVEILIARGCIIDRKLSPYAYQCPGGTALNVASTHGNPQVLNVLIEAGSRVESFDLGGVSALHAAAFKGCHASLKLLLQAGCRTDSRDENGGTPLTDAARHGSAECLALLIAAGCDIHAVGRNDESPLIQATRRDHIECVELLLNAGANELDGIGEDTASRWAEINNALKCQRLFQARALARKEKKALDESLQIGQPKSRSLTL
jgi:cytohesin